MKNVLLLVAGFSLAFTACIYVPSPSLNWLPLNILAAELSPWIAAFNLIVCAAVFRFHRRLLPLPAAMLLLSLWPLLRLPPGRAPAIVLACFRAVRPLALQPQQLPLGILYYRPQGSGPFAAVIDLYGGAWQRGSPSDAAPFHRYLASQGYAVFAIDYRHAPASRFPAQLEDVRAGLVFIRAHAAEYGVGPARLVLSGHSSGAELALLAAYENTPEPVRGVIAFYPPTDLEKGYVDLPSPDPIHVRSVLETYLGGTPSQVAEQYRAASPISHVRAGLPPTLLLQGSRDHVVKPEFARELNQKLTAAGSRSELVEIPWAEHAFDAVFFGIGNQLSLGYIDKFLKEVL